MRQVWSVMHVSQVRVPLRLLYSTNLDHDC